MPLRRSPSHKNAVFANSIAIILFVFFTCSLKAQNKSNDSLLLQVETLRSKGGKSIQSKAYVDALIELAARYRFRTTDSIKLFAEESLKVSKNINYEAGYALATLRMGDFYSNSGMELLAFENYSKALSLATKLNKPEITVQILKSRAFQEFLSLRLNEAVLTYYKAIDIARTHNLKAYEAALRHNLGYLYFKFELYDVAHTEYLVADSLWVLVKDDFKKSLTNSNMALNAIQNDEICIVEEYMDESIRIIEQQETQPMWLSRSYRLKGKYYFKTDSMNKALYWVKKSDKALRPLVNKREQLDIDHIYSKIYLSLGKFKKAETYTLQSLKTANAVGDSVVQMESYQNLSEIEEKKGNITAALTYFKTSSLIKNKLKAGIKSQRLNLLRTKMVFEQEKEILQLENLKKTRQQQKNFQWIIAALLTSIFVGLILFKSSRREKQLNKKLEEKSKTLEANEIALKKTNANQKTIFSIVGHDLKGPMGSLRELLKVMSNENEKEVLLKNLLPKLNNYTNHVYFTLDNLLNWGKTQMKGENISPVKLNIQAIASEVISLYSEAILKKELNVKLDIDKEISAWADKEDINVVLRNLLSNAIKFTPSKGRIKLTGKSTDNQIILVVEDNGVGMSAEAQKLVCDLNTHYSTFGTNNEKGTGLGLILCKEIIARNNGRLKVKSEKNKGSTFFVYLPKASV